MNIPLSIPDITSLERKYVESVLYTPNLSLGPLLAEFESKFSKYIGTRYAIAVSSGTSGLHLIIKALNIGEGDTVITTPFSFVASANSILFERAIPVFIDIDPDTLNIDHKKIEKYLLSLLTKHSKPPRAILPVHVFGYPCDMEPITEIAEKYGLDIIEDACEALGSEYNGRKVGTFGKAGVFAFYPNKQMTTGEGGMIVTDDKNIASVCRSMRNQGRSEDGSWLLHERLGYNYRLSDINCALGIAQLSRLNEMLRKRSAVAMMYYERLKDIEGLLLPVGHGYEGMSWFVYVVRLSDRYSKHERDRILAGLKKAGIGCNNYFPPIHLQPFYRRLFNFKEGDFPVTEHVSERTIALPFFNNLKKVQVDYVVETLKRLL